jgi:hypothetical protein
MTEGRKDAANMEGEQYEGYSNINSASVIYFVLKER